jgi:predicted amidohydrolase YtcJ
MNERKRPTMTPTTDLILRNGHIRTVDGAPSWASAVAVRNGRYIAIADDVAVEAVRGVSTEIVDLRGRMAMQGITDLHPHMLMGGQAEMFDLNFASSLGVDDICAAVRTWAERQPAGRWIVGAQFGTDKLPALNRAPSLAKPDASSLGHPCSRETIVITTAGSIRRPCAAAP